MSPVRRFLSVVLAVCAFLGALCVTYALVFHDAAGVVLALFVYLASTPFIAFWIADYPSS